MATLTELMVEEVELLERLREIEEEIIDAGGEVDDELDREYNTLLDALLRTEGDVEKKIDAYGAVMTELEQEIEAVKGREKPVKDVVKNLRSRRKALQQSCDRMKERIMLYLDELGIDRIDGDNFRFRRQPNGGRRPIHVDSSVRPEDLPDNFTRKEIDYDEIREGLKEIERLREQEDALYEEWENHTRLRDQKCEEESFAWHSADGEAAEVERQLKRVGKKLAWLEGALQGCSLGERGEHIRKF